VDAETQKQVVNRLASIAGHVEGVKRMVNEGAYCIDAIRQLQAVQGALSKVESLILESHLRTCVTNAVRGNDPDERERVLREIGEVFRTSNRS
jgi:CsoR family transcriptional regulator, copper-sensing transcriptional repressor